MPMNQKLQIKGLWVPLITPFYRGEFDRASMINLMKEIEPFVDGLVPCLSSGEGEKMTNQLWEEILKTVAENTDKPVAVGILRNSIAEIAALSEKAKQYGCIAIAVTMQGENDDDRKRFSEEISLRSALLVILYNTEKVHISDTDTLVDISHNENIVALKDSSQNQEFFNEALQVKREGKLSLSILQGMENQLLESAGCDGYLISLANVEPKLCKDMFLKPSPELNDQIMEKWGGLNLASENWFVGIKESLASRGIIKSSESM